MKRSTCPAPARLVRYLDRDLSQEQWTVVHRHVRGCPACRAWTEAEQATLSALAAPALHAFDTAEHVASVMAQLDAPRSSRTALRGRRVFARAALALALAACAGLAYVALVRPSPVEVAARGGGARGATIARDIGVQAYAAEAALRPLTPGAVIATDTPLTASFRNLGVERAYLLLFTVDARDTVRWIAPAYRSVATDPQAVRLPVRGGEQLLGERVVWDDLPPGPLRIMAVVTTAPSHVSDIEALEGHGVDASTITRRLPHAEIRQWRVEVRAGHMEGQR